MRNWRYTISEIVYSKGSLHMMRSDVNAIIIFGSNGFYPSETLKGDTGSKTKSLALDIKLRFAIACKCIGIMFMYCNEIDWFGAHVVLLSARRKPRI